MRFERYGCESELFVVAPREACTGQLLTQHLYIDNSEPYWLMRGDEHIEATGPGVVQQLTGDDTTTWVVHGEDTDQICWHDLAKENANPARSRCSICDERPSTSACPNCACKEPLCSECVAAHECRPEETAIQKRYAGTRWHHIVSALTNNVAVLRGMSVSERKNARTNARRRCGCYLLVCLHCSPRTWHAHHTDSYYWETILYAWPPSLLGNNNRAVCLQCCARHSGRTGSVYHDMKCWRWLSRMSACTMTAAIACYRG